jgi:non-heme chloroperoxidase
MASTGTPVVFVHGLWLHADSWGSWVDLFREAGYAPIAPPWPGDSSTVEETRNEPDRVAGYGINDVVEHYAGVISGLDAKPIVIGHSFGGIIVQRLLGENVAATGVAIDPAPIKGILYLPPSSLRVASIALRNPASRNRAVALTRKQFRYGFGNAVSEEESNDLYERWAIASPGKPLFEVAFANFSPRSPAKVATDNAIRGPLLITAGGKDRTVPRAVSQSTLKRYGASHPR